MNALETNKSELHDGLENIVVAETEMSDVRGKDGVLIIRGFNVEELGEISSFESTALLLWQGKLPSKGDEHDLIKTLGLARQQVFPKLLALQKAIPLPPSALEFQRSCLSAIDTSGKDLVRQRIEVLAVLTVAPAIWYQIKTGQTPVSPDPNLTTAADLLAMISGKAPDGPLTQGVDRYLTTVSDHGMNASTFAARVVASTGSDLVSSIAAGLGALKGPLHGGAPGPVLDMLDAIAKPENAEDWIVRQLADGHRIMGMGHRIYKVRDPRAAVLERGLELLEKNGMKTKRLKLARAVERAAVTSLQKKYPTRELHANVEFYTAVLLDTLGFDRTIFTAIFAIGRSLGWCAHYSEQVQKGRLIRPESRYVGVK